MMSQSTIQPVHANPNKASDFRIFRSHFGQLMIEVGCSITGQPIVERVDCSKAHLNQVAKRCRKEGAGAVEIRMIAESRSKRAELRRKTRSESREATRRIDALIDSGYMASTSDLKIAGLL